MKIWCALGNRKNSTFFFRRISRVLQAQGHTLKFSGYSINYPFTDSFYCLDNIVSAYEALTQFFNNKEYWLLLQQIKKFNPDIILSDLDPIISAASHEIKKPIWQISPLLLYFGIENTNLDTDIRFQKHRLNINKYISKFLQNADRKLIYSPFGNFNFYKLNTGFEWVKPFTLTCDQSIEKETSLIIDLYKTSSLFFLQNKEINYIDNYIYNYDFNHYIKLINQHQSIIHDGTTDILSDVIFNFKHNLLFFQGQNPECYINYVFAKQLEIAQDILNFDNINTQDILLKQDIKFLSDLLI